jgi:hypothetical protein
MEGAVAPEAHLRSKKEKPALRGTAGLLTTKLGISARRGDRVWIAPIPLWRRTSPYQLCSRPTERSRGTTALRKSLAIPLLEINVMQGVRSAVMNLVTPERLTLRKHGQPQPDRYAPQGRLGRTANLAVSGIAISSTKNPITATAANARKVGL